MLYCIFGDYNIPDINRSIKRSCNSSIDQHIDMKSVYKYLCADCTLLSRSRSVQQQLPSRRAFLYKKSSMLSPQPHGSPFSLLKFPASVHSLDNSYDHLYSSSVILFFFRLYQKISSIPSIPVHLFTFNNPIHLLPSYQTIDTIPRSFLIHLCFILSLHSSKFPRFWLRIITIWGKSSRMLVFSTSVCYNKKEVYRI